MARRRRSKPARPQPPRVREDRRPSRLIRGGLAPLIVIAGAWAYANSFSGVFVLDDMRAVVLNPTIRTLSPLSVPLSPPPASTVSGRPIANLTFAIDYALADGNPWGYHATNLAIHLAAALLLFGVVRRTLETERLRDTFGDAAPYLAAIVAALWVVHPLQTEAVTYIVQRVESLMSLFYLLTIYAAIRATSAGRVRSRWWSAVSVFSCALGMATKEVMVTAPVVVALWDRVFRTYPGTRPRRGLLAALAATWIVFALLVANEGRAPSLDLHGPVVLRYLLTQTAVILHYIRLALVPSPLVFLYDWPLAASFASIVAPAAIVGALVVLSAIAVARRQPLGFVGAWFFVILAPTSSVVPIVTEVAAEHRMYLPVAAVIALVVCGGYALAAALATRRPQITALRSQAAAAAVVLVVAVVAVLGAMTRARNRTYASERALWEDTVRTQPSNVRARVAYGSALATERRLAEAEAQLRTAVELDPSGAVAHTRLGTVLAAQGKVDAAIAELNRALALSRDDADAHRALGRLYASRRQDALAVAHLQRAVDLVGNDPSLLIPLAALLTDSEDSTVRDTARALSIAERAAQLTGRQDPVALDVLSVAQANLGRLAEATSTAREALAIAQAQGNAPLARQLEYRIGAYTK